MIVSFVVAVARNGVIGREGGLPWHISSDLKRFKEITMGKPVVMGRKTWESLPRRPLPGRRNLVLSHQWGYQAAGAEVFRSFGEVIEACKDAPEICIIGGGKIYQEFKSLANRLYLTEVDLVVAGDTYFKSPNAAEWREIAREVHPKGPNDSAGFVLRILERDTKN